MKRSLSRLWAAAVAAGLLCSLSLPAFAFPWSREKEAPYVADLTKNGLIGETVSFAPEDFTVKGGDKSTLTAITVDTLPDPGTGVLLMGKQPLEAGASVDCSALNGLRFRSAPAPTAETAKFTVTPTFSPEGAGKSFTVVIHLLTEQNAPPVARNMDLSTYRNIAITGYFDAVDGEGDDLTFQLTSTPALGAVTMAEDGSSRFVYTPYENKTGSDAFTYVAVDPAGNTSPEARVTVRIEKAGTAVTYADLEGHSAHKGAIRLAEEGIYVGRRLGDTYFFDGDAPVSRAQFLTMAMEAAGLEAMEGVTLTGFSDDEAIPTWAKGQVSAALKAGAVQGSRNEDGAHVFGAGDAITRAEATVMLNRLLNVTDVPTEVFFGGETHWAAQAAANLAASGILPAGGTNAAALSMELTMAEAAEMLDGALDLMEAREGGGWLGW